MFTYNMGDLNRSIDRKKRSLFKAGNSEDDDYRQYIDNGSLGGASGPGGWS